MTLCWSPFLDIVHHVIEYPRAQRLSNDGDVEADVEDVGCHALDLPFLVGDDQDVGLVGGGQDAGPSPTLHAVELEDVQR